jgi:hypothetical protein
VINHLLNDSVVIKMNHYLFSKIHKLVTVFNGTECLQQTYRIEQFQVDCAKQQLSFLKCSIYACRLLFACASEIIDIALDTLLNAPCQLH